MARMTNTSFMTGVKNWVLGKIANIMALIPNQASSSNQLADKNFVNSSIATATATFRGTYNVVSDLSLSYNATHAQIEAALAMKMAELSIVADNNDYAFVQIPTTDATPTQIAKIEKYKYNGTAWAFEYELNNSGFTAAQWAAINSGATLELIGKLSALPTNAELTTILNGKASKAANATTGHFASLDANGNPTDSGISLEDNGAYDVTAHNSGAKFADLSALLSNVNLNTLIPIAVRKGGMSIKFVQSSDNKYVQYLYHDTSIAVTDFTNTNNWEKLNLEEEVRESEQSTQKSFSALGYADVIQHNGYLKANGDYEGTSSYHSITSKKISCKEGDVFKYKGDGHGEAVSALFYNNGVISSSYQVNSTSNYANITIPANVDSVVFSSFAGISENVVFKLILVTEVISQIEQDVDNIAILSSNNDKALNGETKSAYSNLPYNTTLLSCSILKSTKFQIKVEVEGGQSPTFSRFIINYNDSTASNKRLMDTTNLSFLGTWMDFVAPDDLEYLGFYTDTSHANIRMYLKTYGIIQEIGTDNFPLKNKIGVSFGDSIMAGDGNSGVGVLDLLIRDYGCTGQDYAVGGASCAYHEGRGHIVAQIQSYIQNHLSDDLDFILLDGLSNDITTSELGELSASFDYVAGGYADYTKGLEYCIGLLTNSFPTIPIIYFIPHSTPARDYSNELAFGNRAREVCKKWSIPVADIYLDGCLNTRINSQHNQYGDASGTHPNEAGYLHSYIPLISSELIKILPSD